MHFRADIYGPPSKIHPFSDREEATVGRLGNLLRDATAAAQRLTGDVPMKWGAARMVAPRGVV